MIITRYYDQGAKPHNNPGRTVELHFDDGRVIQLSAIESQPKGGTQTKSVLLRCFNKNGTVEYGGSNATSVTLTIVERGDAWQIQELFQLTPLGSGL